MNILVLTSTFPDNTKSWNGIFVKEQVDALSKEHNVCVVKCEVDYNSFKPFFKAKVQEDSNLGYPVYRIIVNKSFPIYNQLNYLVTVYWKLKRIISKHNPDIIHCHYSYPSGIVALLVKRFYKIPFVVTEHTRIRATFRSYLHRVLSLMAMRKSFKVIAVSNSLKQEIIDEGVNNIEVIPNVISTDRFKLSTRGIEPFIIGFLGSLNTHNKGLDTLLKACVNLPFSYRIKIGGSGKYLEYYKNLSEDLGISQKCCFCGNISQPDIPNFYSDLSVFILASKYETFGIVLVEAMAAGIPVVATRCGGSIDIVNETNGILVDTDSPEQILDALIKIHKNYLLYNSEDIRNYAQNKFSEVPFLQRANEIYCSCLPK